MELTTKQKKALKYLKIRTFEKDLRRFSLKELKKEFAAKSSKRILMAPLIRNIAFQAANWMKEGKSPKVEGNLRSFFYQWIKPVISKIPGGLSKRFDPYDNMLDVLEILISKYKFFKYRDLDLMDENWEHRFYTDGRNSHVLVFAEKNGFVRFIKEVQKEYGVSTIALGGFPSHLSTEYFVEGLKKRLKKIPPLVLIGITDYDPSGYFVARAFQNQLKNQGIKIQKYISLIKPKHYSKEEIEIFRYPIPSKYKKRIEGWMKKTKGINGEPFGLEADAMPKSRLREILREKLEPFLEKEKEKGEADLKEKREVRGRRERKER